MVQANVVADLFERTCITERRDAVDPGLVASTSDAGRHGNHVLLGHPCIDESRLECLLQRLERHEAEITGHKEVRLARRKGHHGAAKFISHGSSPSAASYCSRVSGR